MLFSVGEKMKIKETSERECCQRGDLKLVAGGGKPYRFCVHCGRHWLMSPHSEAPDVPLAWPWEKVGAPADSQKAATGRNSIIGSTAEWMPPLDRMPRAAKPEGWDRLSGAVKEKYTEGAARANGNGQEKLRSVLPAMADFLYRQVTGRELSASLAGVRLDYLAIAHDFCREFGIDAEGFRPERKKPHEDQAVQEHPADPQAAGTVG